jgi:hypothetical protein
MARIRLPTAAYGRGCGRGLDRADVKQGEYGSRSCNPQ